MKRTRRRIYEITWNRTWREWILRLLGTPRGDFEAADTSKRWLVQCAASIARENAPSELVIKNRNGRIGKGSSGRRTYGCDPRRHRG